MQEVKPTIQYDEFSKVDVRLGSIVESSLVEGSDKLIKLLVDFGSLGQRQILTGIAKYYAPADLVGKQTTFVINLAPRKMMGLESQGMIFAAGLGDGTKPVFLLPEASVENGDGVR